MDKRCRLRTNFPNCCTPALNGEYCGYIRVTGCFAEAAFFIQKKTQAPDSLRKLFIRNSRLDKQ
jgi:hypothetical protein